MAHSLLWLPTVLESAGLKVAPVPGWETRSRRDVKQILGVICHHTATKKPGNMPSLRTLIEGTDKVPGPLAQLGLGRDGTYYVVAAGRCNHAGTGSWKGIATGNDNFIGIEGENGGGPDEMPWPEVQMDAYRRGVAALLKHVNRPVEFCAAHKEYAPTRKPYDPLFDMNMFRGSVAAILNGTTPPPILIPPVEPPGAEGTVGRPTLRRGSTGEAVLILQKKLVSTNADGFFGPKTEAAVRVFQRQHDLVPDGIVGPKTWRILDTV